MADARGRSERGRRGLTGGCSSQSVSRVQEEQRTQRRRRRAWGRGRRRGNFNRRGRRDGGRKVMVGGPAADCCRRNLIVYTVANERARRDGRAEKARAGERYVVRKRPGASATIVRTGEAKKNSAKPGERTHRDERACGREGARTSLAAASRWWFRWRGGDDHRGLGLPLPF